MVEKIILINSANFNFLEVDLHKDLFFLGDNGSGKTTVIRAIHYLFSGDVRNLGIPSDKEGFKEYYFKYANSYMIYQFSDFFIFMYKSGNEIIKIFSKQKFDFAHVIKEDGTLYELESIKRYARSVHLKKTVKSFREYRDIVYGNEKKYLDFKFTFIKNSDTFLALFNEIFNIDKSIIDSKSIKKAIQTTLDYDTKVIDFNHEEYLHKIYEFQSEYKFFKEFEKQKENIESAYAIKEQLLEYEKNIFILKENIAYRVKYEKVELEKLESKFRLLEEHLDSSREFYKVKKASLLKCEKSFQLKADALRVEIGQIRALKEKFSQKRVLVNRDLADRYEEIKERLSEHNQSYIQLKQGFENELDNINKEIKNLYFRRDKELLQEESTKRFNKKQLLENVLYEEIQKLELAYDAKQSKAEIDIYDINQEILSFEVDVQREKLQLNTIHEEQSSALKTLKNSYESKEESLKQTLKQSLEKIDTKEREIKKISHSLEDLQRDKEQELFGHKKNYNVELQNINQELQKYKAMVYSQPDSFKEFLNEEVDGWERELYPILDDSVLDMSIKELAPQLLSDGRVLSLSFDNSKLKKILTKEEANQKIEALESAKSTLEESYKNALSALELKYKEIQEKLQEQQSILSSEILNLQEEVKTLQNSILSLAEELKSAQSEMQKMHAKNIQAQNRVIENLHNEIHNNNQEVEKINKALKSEKISLSKEINYLKVEYGKNLQIADKELSIWLKAEQEKVDALIASKNEQKHKITKDERLKELESAIEKSQKDLEKSLNAKVYLQEYESSKEYIAMLNQKVNALETMQLKNSEFEKRLTLKIENYEHAIENFKEEKIELKFLEREIKKGEKFFEPIAHKFIDVLESQSEEYLYVLVEQYSALLRNYEDKKIDLKGKLDKVNRLKDSQNEIDINFNIDELENALFLSHIPNIALKLDEIVEFKNKKLELVKQSGNQRFISFVNNMLPQKMSVFSDSEDKFFAQVAKINKNLSSIDFGVIKDIKIDTKLGEKKSIAKLLNELNTTVTTLSSLLSESSLFYDKNDILVELNLLERKFKEIKVELKGNAISLEDTIDLTLSFNENGKKITQVSQLKNESSTGGSMLLKIAIAISILKLFISEEKTPFFLIVDEVSRLHSINQEKLRKFANSKGFGIVFVTPEPTYSKPDAIKYYRFRKNIDNEFEAVELNV